jgi:hypothetical protein
MGLHGGAFRRSVPTQRMSCPARIQSRPGGGARASACLHACPGRGTAVSACRMACPRPWGSGVNGLTRLPRLRGNLAGGPDVSPRVRGRLAGGAEVSPRGRGRPSIASVKGKSNKAGRGARRAEATGLRFGRGFADVGFETRFWEKPLSLTLTHTTGAVGLRSRLYSSSSSGARLQRSGPFRWVCGCAGCAADAVTDASVRTGGFVFGQRFCYFAVRKLTS